MITYEYECSACDENFDVMQSIKDDAFTVCPNCNKDTLERVLHPPMHVHVIGEPTTVGQIAERNSKHMSKEEMMKTQERWVTEKTINRTPEEYLPKSLPNESAGPTPDWVKKNRSKTTKEVIGMTPEQTKKYVQEGV